MMEYLVYVIAHAIGSFMVAFIITWVISRPVRWFVVSIAPSKREAAVLSALAIMILVAIVSWKADITFDIALCVAIAIHLVLDWAWAKHPGSENAANAPASSNLSNGNEIP